MNPFAELSTFMSPLFMQVYVVVMILAVAGGTVFDVLHKHSGEFFAQHRKKSKATATKPLSGMDNAVLAIRTFLNEVVTAGELQNPNRRISHLLLFYGFLLYLVTTIAMVFAYSSKATPTPAVWPVLWNIGALMVMGGGYWFFFLLRVDVVKEGHSPFQLTRADLFIVSLLMSVTFALIWEIVQLTGNVPATAIFYGIYLFFTTLLFVSVPWSKFAHMFYKPAAAFQRRVETANGSTDLPTPSRGHRS